jgi:hypothetical protein
MNTKIVFQIGREVSPIDSPPFRAFIYWLNQGKLLRAEDFSEMELVKRIELLRKEAADDSDSLGVFEDALVALKKLN